MENNSMDLYLANPRGFCAGVERAILTVERALELYGRPIYVRHEIVHNQHVVNELHDKGAVFVEELDEIPDGAVVIFSAHGVSQEVMKEGNRRNLRVIDATCPLVTKVHKETQNHAEEGREQIIIGHAGHPEVEGTMGQVEKGMYLVSSVEDVESLNIRNPEHLAFVTQTTLSVDEAADIIGALYKRFPNIQGPKQEDICYATQNRQDAVKLMLPDIEILLVVGSNNSSNSNRLRELGERYGIPSHLVNSSDEINPKWLKGIKRIGVTAGASAPEHLVQQVLDRLKQNEGQLNIKDVIMTQEDVQFSLPI